MKPAIALLCALLAATGAHAGGNDAELENFLKTRERIATACREAPRGELCRVYLHGVLQGVRATGAQASKMAEDWADVYERNDRSHPYAWLARDILHAASCSPDALAFVSRYAGQQEVPPGSAEAHVEHFCAPIWAEHRLRAPASPPRAISLR